MTQVSQPPVYNPLADETGKATLPWLQFFNAVYVGDTGTAWNPLFTGLAGAAQINGIYYLVGKLCYFRIDIIPVTSTTSTSGSTYVNNFPLMLRGFGACAAVTNAPSAALGMADSTTNRIYAPSWSGITSQVTLCGLVEAN